MSDSATCADALTTTSVPVAPPWYRLSLTVAATVYVPAFVGAAGAPSYVTSVARAGGSVPTVTARAVPSYTWFVSDSVTAAGAFRICATTVAALSAGTCSTIAQPTPARFVNRPPCRSVSTTSTVAVPKPARAPRLQSRPPFVKTHVPWLCVADR